MANFTLPMIPSYHVFLFDFFCFELGYTGLSVYSVNIGYYNIGKFSEKFLIATINSSSMNCLVRQQTIFLLNVIIT